MNSAAADVSRVLQNMQFASEYYPVVFSESVERQSSQHLLLFASLASLIGIFFILQACFRSWGLALVIFATLPLRADWGVRCHACHRQQLVAWQPYWMHGRICHRSSALHSADWALAGRGTRKEASFGTGLVQRGACEQFAPILMTMVAASASRFLHSSSWEASPASKSCTPWLSSFCAASSRRLCSTFLSSRRCIGALGVVPSQRCNLKAG